MAGGSTSQKVVSEESISEETLATMGEEPRFEKGSKVEEIAIINSDPSCSPLMEIST